MERNSVGDFEFNSNLLDDARIIISTGPEQYDSRSLFWLALYDFEIIVRDDPYTLILNSP